MSFCTAISWVFFIPFISFVLLFNEFFLVKSWNFLVNSSALHGRSVKFKLHATIAPLASISKVLIKTFLGQMRSCLIGSHVEGGYSALPPIDGENSMRGMKREHKRGKGEKLLKTIYWRKGSNFTANFTIWRNCLDWVCID